MQQPRHARVGADRAKLSRGVMHGHARRGEAVVQRGVERCVGVLAKHASRDPVLRVHGRLTVCCAHPFDAHQRLGRRQAKKVRLGWRGVALASRQNLLAGLHADLANHREVADGCIQRVAMSRTAGDERAVPVAAHHVPGFDEPAHRLTNSGTADGVALRNLVLVGQLCTRSEPAIDQVAQQ